MFNLPKNTDFEEIRDLKLSLQLKLTYRIKTGQLRPTKTNKT